MVEQEGARVGIELVFGEEILGEDAADEFSRSGFVLHLGELPRDQPLDYGLRHPSCVLISTRHGPGRLGYTRGTGVSIGTIRKISRKVNFARSAAAGETSTLC